MHEDDETQSQFKRKRKKSVLSLDLFDRPRARGTAAVSGTTPQSVNTDECTVLLRLPGATAEVSLSRQ